MNVLHKSYEHETHTHTSVWMKMGSKKEIREHFTVLALYIFVYAWWIFFYSFGCTFYLFISREKLSVCCCMCSRRVPEWVCKCETIVHHSDCIMKYDVSQGNEARKWNQDESVRCDGTNLPLVFASGRIRPNNNGTERKKKLCVCIRREIIYREEIIQRERAGEEE